MLRVDLSLFESIEELSHVLNRVPWDFIYQEWWWEKPDPMRHRYIGHFRDITYRPEEKNHVFGQPTGLDDDSPVTIAY
jgi:hypothetical protein